MRGRGRGASNASGHRPLTRSLQSTTPAVPVNPVVQIQPGQVDFLTQQIQALATAVQDLQQAGLQPQPQPQPPAELSLPRAELGSPDDCPHPSGVRGGEHRSRRSSSQDSSSSGPRRGRPSKKSRRAPRPSGAGSLPGSPVQNPTTLLQTQSNRLDRKVEELERRLQDIQTRGPGRDANPEVAVESPFAHWIEDAPLPSKFKMPQIESYTGAADPLDHLESYRALMSLQGAPEELLCRAFPVTLRGTARLWFCAGVALYL